MSELDLGLAAQRVVTCVEPTSDWSDLIIPRIKTMADSPPANRKKDGGISLFPAEGEQDGYECGRCGQMFRNGAPIVGDRGMGCYRCMPRQDRPVDPVADQPAAGPRETTEHTGPAAAGPQETTEPAPVESFWMENRIHQLMGVESDLNKQLAEAKALNKHYEKVLDRLVHNSIDAFPTPASRQGLQEVLTDTQCDYLSRESNPVVWLVRGKVESQNHFTYEPYDLEMDAHIEFYTEEPDE